MHLLNTIGKACVIPWEISINNPTPNTSQEKTAQENNPNRWTIKRLLDWTSDYFKESGFSQPRLDAEVLLSEALECRRIELYTRFDDEPPELVKGKFRDWVARHAEGEPVAYLVGQKEFFSLEFKVNQHVLIPRPETEHLVTESLDFIKSLNCDSVQVVDVGTGSGCVATAICKHAPNTRMVACDISEEALQVARQNAEVHGVQERICFQVSDLLANVAEPAEFHLIVSNPPYIGLSEKDGLDKSVVDFEPHQALFSTGQTGTETIERLIEQASERLAVGGMLMMEISPIIADACQQLIEASNLHFERFVNDLASHKRIIVACNAKS